MTVPAYELYSAASHLLCYLLGEPWSGQALAGPDSSIRFNAWIGRFIKSYPDPLPWSDRYTYLRAQKQRGMIQTELVFGTNPKKAGPKGLICAS